MRLVALLAALAAFTACSDKQCGPDCTIFEKSALGTVEGDIGFDPVFDRDGNGSIDTFDFQSYLEDCSR